MSRSTITTLHSPSNSPQGKLYKIHLQETSEGLFHVLYSNGKAGGSMSTPKPKTPVPLPYIDAKKAADALINKQLSKTYTLVKDDDDLAQMTDVSPTDIDKSKFCTMPLRSIPDPEPYITSPRYFAQMKYDGERRPIQSINKTVTGYGRYGQIKPVFKTTAEAIAGLDIKIDCEAMSDHYRVFDLLVLHGEDISQKPFSYRYEKLMALLNTLDIPTLKLVEAFNSEVNKRRLLKECEQNNYEGMVFKAIDSVYIAASSTNAKWPQLKYKLTNTLSCLVSGKNPTKRSVPIHVYDDQNAIMPIGNVTIPTNAAIPDENQIIEVRYRHATKSNSLIEPTYLGLRNDVDLSDCSYAQLVYTDH